MDHQGLKLCRRRFLASAAAFTVAATTASARSISGKLPWSPFAGDPPKPVNPLGWYFLTPNEVAAVEAIVDRSDPGGSSLRSAARMRAARSSSTASLPAPSALPAVFTSRGHSCRPAHPGLSGRVHALGPLSPGSEGARRSYPRHLSGKTFAQLSSAQQDEVLEGMESGKSRRSNWRRASRPAPSSNCCCRTPWKASLPIRFMAATATW